MGAILIPRVWLWALAGMSLGAAGCVDPGAFECSTSDQCIRGGGAGTCQASGYCSFADPGCASGQRYDDSATEDLAGTCVGDLGGGPDGGTDGAVTDAGDGGTCPATNAIREVAAGGFHTCAITGGDTALCFGANDQGQLGDGTYSDRGLAAPVVSLVEVRALALGNLFSCAIIGDGGVACWGANDTGQLGDGTQSGRTEPASVAGLSSVTQLEIGEDSACAVTGGEAWCWGDGDNGQLGDGDYTSSTAPTKVGSMNGEAAVQVSVGDDFACAVTAGHHLWCWGNPDDGELGNGTLDAHGAPAQAAIDASTEVVSVSAGYGHACAVIADGTVLCWGDNDAGQLGAGFSSDYEQVPTTVTALAGVTSVGCGDDFSCALTAGGAVYCWGQNGWGQLGTAPSDDHSAPSLVEGLEPAVGITVGRFHACAWTAAGEMSCWGLDSAGQLGDAALIQTTPAAVEGAVDVTSMGVGTGHTCVVKNDETAWCWGLGDDGQLGGDTYDSSSALIKVRPLATYDAIGAGSYHSCAIDSGGQVYCWGANWAGQLGDGTTDYHSAPVAIDPLPAAAVAVDGGEAFTCAVDGAGAVWCWGVNDDGQLGDGTGTMHSSPVQVSGLSGATVLGTGRAFGCALASDAGGEAAIYCWGANYSGQLGNSSAGDRELLPVKVGIPDPPVAVFVGGFHACAITEGVAGRRVYCWGANWSGQLGDGSQIDSDVPLVVSGLDDVVALAAGDFHTCALTFAGTVYCWGENGDGQLGTGDRAVHITPAPVIDLPPVTEIAASERHTCARTGEGQVYCWGSDVDGRLGSGRALYSGIPVTPARGCP